MKPPSPTPPYISRGTYSVTLPLSPPRSSEKRSASKEKWRHFRCAETRGGAGYGIPGIGMECPTNKKGKQIFLVYKEIQSGAVAKSYMRKVFLIYEEMRKYFTIYEEAVSHI